MKSSTPIPVVLVIGICAVLKVVAGTDNMPVKIPQQHKEIEHYRLRNLISFNDLYAIINTGNKAGFALQCSHITTLLDGSVVDPQKIYGTCYYGPQDFEAQETNYRYARFRLTSTIQNGKATMPVGRLLASKYNSEEWTDGGRLAVRFELYEAADGPDRSLGIYDIRMRFKQKDGTFIHAPSLITGPYVNLLNSDHPDSLVISFTTDRKVNASVVLSNGKKYSSSASAVQHIIPVNSLKPSTRYRYFIDLNNEAATRQFSIKTAPPKGDARVVFGYAGDSREGVGTGDEAFMGVNRKALLRLWNIAYQNGADFFAMGGDLMNGYTSVVHDFEMQMTAYKEAISGFWHERPVYPAMGNHETLLRVFDDGGKYGLSLDRWPYATQSAEAIFKNELVNPGNAPSVSDARRPTYNENVYSYDYGPVRMISFNNNYWYANNPEKTGGSPQGYLFDDQLQWIKRQLEDAQNDATVKYVLLYAQEPVFPCGGHVKDAMWYHGNNDMRGWIKDKKSGKLKPAPKGIIEVRNELASMVAKSTKVAAVLGSDEHAYYRILIDKNVPIGLPEKDTDKGSDVVCRKGGSCSPMKALKHATWYITSGGAGAPYYAEEQAPWNAYWLENQKKPGLFYYYSSQSHLMLFEADADKISCRTINQYGEVIDSVDDLMAVKHSDAKKYSPRKK
ncbi:MAG: hypothetical protein GF398_14795 [Chitinivibrionales bacterium]|nr:hypothetical protein [Chitinivibrionales bacterium]